MIKILTPNKDGKIEFTKEELEALLKEVNDEAFELGVKTEKSRQKTEKSGISNIPNNDLLNAHLKPEKEKKTLEFWWDQLSEEERRKMLYVDYENLPKYDSDPYEKIPYWMRPDFKIPVMTCTDLHSTAGASKDLTSVTTCFNNSAEDTSTINEVDHTVTAEAGTYDRYNTTKQRQDDVFKYSKKVIMNK